MKCIFFFAVIFFTSIILSSSSCKKSGPPTCGCDAPTRAIIPDSANLIATISYHTESIQGHDYYKNKFFIEYTERNCSNCVHYMVICNEGVLPQQVLNLRYTGFSLQAKFAGYLKPVCDKVFAPGDYTYENIILTKIEVQ